MFIILGPKRHKTAGKSEPATLKVAPVAVKTEPAAPKVEAAPLPSKGAE
jgi:hypothetical protein